MVGSRKLSNDEVEALLGGLEGEEEQTTAAQFDPNEVREFTFGSEDLSLLGDYYALRMINEKICRFTRSVFLPMLRLMPRISSFPPEVKSFDEYVESCDQFVSVTNNRIEELRGNCLIVIQAPFISHLTNSYYGGPAEPPNSKRTEFTGTETRLIELVTSGLASALQNSWRDLMPITLTEIGREVNPQFAAFVDGSDLVIVCSFVVQLPDLDPVNFDIIYPLQTLRPIASQLRSRVQSESGDDDVTWREKMESAILNIPLSITALLGEPALSMGQLIRLKEGDVVPVQINEGVEVRVEDNAMFVAEMGEVAGQVAVNLTKRI